MGTRVRAVLPVRRSVYGIEVHHLGGSAHCVD